MAEMVEVVLIQPINIRLSKDDKYVSYRPGRQQIPLTHAKAAGLLHRVDRTVAKNASVEIGLEDLFNEPLLGILKGAGYTSSKDLKKASQDDLLALGIGPAGYEQVQLAVKGKK